MELLQGLVKIHLYRRPSVLFQFGLSTKTSKSISVQSKTCYLHRQSYPPVRNAVQKMKLLVTMFSPHTFSLLHPHI